MSSSPTPDSSNDAPRVLGSLLALRAPPPSESEWVGLVSDIASGDQGALRELYERTSRIVFTLIFRIVKDAEAAEEVTLDVYHGVWRRATTYDPARGTVIGWLMGQARSQAIDCYRHEHRKKRMHDGKLAAHDESQVDRSAEEERSNELARALEALTVDERRAIETAYFDELTYAEAADRLSTPLGTIKTRIRSGLAKLRTLLPYKEDV